MKTSFSLLVISVLFTQVLALPAGRTVQDLNSEAVSACGNSRDAVALLRAWNPSVSDHFYTTNAAEMENAIAHDGYSSEGDAAHVFTSQTPSTIPLYRLYSGGGVHDHFYTTSASERDNAVAHDGYTSEGTAAFVYPTGECGGIPLYRAYSGRARDHFYTTSASERDNAVTHDGYVDEGVAAYVLRTG